MACVVVLVLDFVLAILLPRHALRIGVGSLCLDAGMLMTFVPLYRLRPFALSDLGLRVTAGARAVGLTFAALVAYVAIAAIWGLAVLGLHRHQITPQLHAGAGGIVAAGVALCLAAPVVEELFFRGLLYRALRNRLSVTWSVLIVAVLFAAGHAGTYPADTLPIKAAFGVITCLLYERTGSLYPGIALHCLIDSTGYEASVSHGEIWIAPLAFAALGLTVLLRHRFRAPTVTELAAFRQHPSLEPNRRRSQPGSVHSSERKRHLDALAIRFGYHSPRWVLGMLGGLLIAGVFLTTVITTTTHPNAHPGNSTTAVVLGLLLILGLLMIITAIIWQLFRRPPHA